MQTQGGDVYSVIRYIHAMNRALPKSKRLDLEAVPQSKGFKEQANLWDWIDKYQPSVEQAISDYLDETFEGLQD